jgi:SynChlorMet cassette radical SAM/SPASM protein ScmF
MPTEEAASSQPKNYLGVEVFEQAVTEAKPLGLQTVKWTGGEPTIHPELPRLLQIQRKHELRGIMETNGIEVTRALAGTMQESGVDFISVSLDASTPELHDFVRGVRGAYEGALRGVRHLVEAGYRPQLIMSLMRENIADVDNLFDLAEKLGAGSVKLNIIQPSSRGAAIHEQDDAVSVGEILDLYHRVREDHQTRYPFKIHVDIPLGLRPIGQLLHSDCGVCGIKTSLGLLAGGEYALCGVGSMESELVFGRVGVDALAEVWQRNGVLQTVRTGIPDQFEGICGRCIMAPACQGSCVAQNYMRSRSILGAHWLCAAAERMGFFPATRLRQTSPAGWLG